MSCWSLNLQISNRDKSGLNDSWICLCSSSLLLTCHSVAVAQNPRWLIECCQSISVQLLERRGGMGPSVLIPPLDRGRGRERVCRGGFSFPPSTGG